MLEQQARLAATAGVLPLTVELAFEDEPFAVTSSSDARHLQLRWPRGVGPLWSKENLINAAVEKLLPHDWLAVGFIDAEVAMDNPQWAVDALRMLTNGTADAVQPFAVVRHFGYEVLSMASFLATHGAHGLGTTWGLTAGHQGMGWVWNRRAYDALGGVYERCILGSADSLIAGALYADVAMMEREMTPRGFSARASAAFIDYIEAGRRVAGSRPLRVGFVPGRARHTEHGSLDKRAYVTRQSCLRDYDPALHVARDASGTGLLLPTPAMPAGVLTCTRAYFASRHEDERVVPAGERGV